MSDVDRAFHAIGHVYDAGFDRARWPDTLAVLSDLIGGSAALLLTRTTAGEWTCPAAAGVAPADADRYADRWRRYDPLFTPPDSQAVGVRRVRRDECGDTPFFLHFADALGWRTGLVAHSADHPDLALVVWSGAPDAFDGRLSILARVWPHVARAWSWQTRRWSPAPGREGWSAALLEHWPVGVVCVAAAGAIAYANQRARELADAEDGFGFAIDGPVAATTADTRRLRAAIRGAAAEPGPGRWLRVTRPSGLRPYEIALRSLRPAADGPGEVALFVSDPEGRPPLPEAALQSLHGLTPSEAAVVQRVTSGASVEAIAADLGISRRTTRWHLEQVRGKLGARNQTELVRLMLTGPIALIAGERPAAPEQK